MVLNLFSSSLFEINTNGSIVHFNKIQNKKEPSSTTEGHVRRASLTEEESEDGAASFHLMATIWSLSKQ